MRAADIQVPGDYEINGGRVTIVAVEVRARTVFSGERWDSNGHPSKGKVAVSDNGTLYAPQQVIRPWAEAEQAHARRAQKRAEQEQAITLLGSALGVLARYVQPRYDFNGQLNLSEISITLSVSQALALADRLSGK